MDDITIIILNGLFWVIVLPVFSFFFPRTATFLRFIPPCVIRNPEPVVDEEEEVQEVSVHIDDVLDFKPTMPREDSEPIEFTDKQLINDAILALVSTGFKKREAKIAVDEAVYNRKFDNVQDIIVATLNRTDG
tara:strand:+ start:160 stop:558 length:399 start_codon:yes stop_codon:yes gene_type:complete